MVSQVLGIALYVELFYLREEIERRLMPRPKVDIRPLILARATELFKQHGYAGVTMRMLSSVCGTSLGNLYTYYESKDELFGAVLRPVLNALSELSKEHNADARVCFEAFCDSRVAMLGETIDFLDEYSDAFYLLTHRAQGSPYENFVSRYLERQMELGKEYLETLKRKYPEAQVDVSTTFIHMRSVEVIQLLGAIVERKLAPEERHRVVREYIAYSMAGWKRLIFPEETARQ